jgi:uncharacterized repeat protein (TIGR01451 family)
VNTSRNARAVIPLAALVASLAVVASASAKSSAADLAVTLSRSPSTVTAGDQVTYTSQVTNNGPDQATNVTLRNWLPGKASFVSATPGQGSCAGSKPFVLCSLGTIASGGSTTVTIVVTANKPGLMVDHVRVRSDLRDKHLRDNDASTKTQVSFRANLDVSLTGSPTSVKVGDQVTYTAKITNNGPDQATNVTLRNWLPGKAIFVSATPGQGSCAGTKPYVLCSVGTLASGGSTTVTIVVKANKSGLMVDHVRVRADQRDPHPRNNVVSVKTHVTK